MTLKTTTIGMITAAGLMALSSPAMAGSALEQAGPRARND